MLDHVAVIIRASGERTEALCRQLLEEAIPAENIVMIHEAPFSKAVERTCEIGTEYGLPWTLAIDADVLIAPQQLAQFVAQAEQKDESYFFYNPYVIDKILCVPRQGGAHLYRTSLLPQSKQFVGQEGTTFRPEAHMVYQMENLGYTNTVIPVTIGVHDYEQYYRDIVRKVSNHIVKSSSNTIDYIRHQWQLLTESDTDYQLMMWIWRTTNGAKLEIQLDSRAYHDHVSPILEMLGIAEKSSTITDFDSDTLQRMIGTFIPNKLLIYALRPYVHRSYRQRYFDRAFWMMKVGSRIEKFAGDMAQRAFRATHNDH